MKQPFLLNNEVVKEIYEEYNSLDIPEKISLVALHEIIKEGFWSTFIKEEERNHLFLIAVTSPDNFVNNEFVYFFKDSISLNRLPKLSPALENTSFQLGVWIDDNEKPYIWGFGKLPSNNLKIEAFKPSQLVVYYPLKFKYLIDSNKSSFLSMFYMWFCVNSPFIQNLPENLKDEKEKSIELNKRYFSVVKIVNQMRRHRHGGILLIVPNNDSWKSSIKDEIPFAPKISYKVFCEKINNLEKNLRLAGQLTAVDGATLMNSDFEILSFGAKISANEIPKRIYVSEPFEIESVNRYISLADLGGTRHQSVAQFIFEQKDSFGVVVSQDGKVSIVFWQESDNHLEIIQHTELWFSTHEEQF